MVCRVQSADAKPVIYAANVGEDDLRDDGASNPHVQAVRKYAAAHSSEVFVICAEIEAELSELDEEEKKDFLVDLGLTESGLDKLIEASYRTLGLMSFLTAGRTKPEHGPSRWEPRRLRRREKSIRILNGALSRRK